MKKEIGKKTRRISKRQKLIDQKASETILKKIIIGFFGKGIK